MKLLQPKIALVTAYKLLNGTNRADSPLDTRNNAEAGAEILAGHIDKYVRVPFFSVNMGQSDAVRQYRIWWLCVATGLL